MYPFNTTLSFNDPFGRLIHGSEEYTSQISTYDNTATTEHNDEFLFSSLHERQIQPFIVNNALTTTRDLPDDLRPYEEHVLSELAPLAFIMGVPWSEASQAASFIWQKIIVNEFVAYIDFVKVAAKLSPKTQAIVTFALCGFANIGSVAMVVGGLGGMVPRRRKEMNSSAMKTLLAFVLANLKL